MSRTTLLACAALVLCTGFEWPGRIAHLKHELARGEADERREAVRRLGAYPAEMVREELLTALEDDDARVRREAALAAGRARVPEAAPLLADWLGERDPELREAAVTALGELGEPSGREPITRALQDAAPAVRRAAARALVRIADEEALLALQAATADPDPSVREAALRALRGRADGRVLPELSARVDDESVDVRIASMELLGALDDPRALPLLLRSAARERDEVELAAVMALGELAARTDVPAASVLPSLRAKLDAEPRVAKAAVAAIGRTPGPSAIQLVVDLLADPELGRAAESALVERARRAASSARGREDDPALTAALSRAIERGDAAAPTLAAEVITEIADLISTADLQPALVRALEQGRGDTAKVARALARTGGPEALVPLLERLSRWRTDAETPTAPRVPTSALESDEPTAAPADSARELEGLLDAMLPYFATGRADGRAVDPLLSQLSGAKLESTRSKLIELLGWTRAPRALPAVHAELADTSLALRTIALEAIGRIGSPESLRVVEPLLSAGDPALRAAAARSYARLTGESEVRELLDWLDGDRAADRGALLTSLGLALGRLRAADALGPETERRALRVLGRWLGAEDPQLSAHALDALRRYGHPAAARIIARELVSPKAARRAAATFALSDFPGDETRRLLRFVLQRSAPRTSAAALIALGEIGDQRDVPAILRVARHAHWPLPAAATYALRRLAEREDVKQRALERGLCELMPLSDPYARANVASALASLGGNACPELDLRTWFASAEPSVVRSAAARWLRARADANADDATLAALLATCSGDPDPLVRASCVPTGDIARRPAEVVALGGELASPLRQRLVALRFADASTFVGYTDENARVLLARVPAGEITLENPGE